MTLDDTLATLDDTSRHLATGGFWGKIVVFEAKTRIWPGFAVFDCRFSLDLLNFSVFYGSTWLDIRRLGFSIANFRGPVGWRISLCFWPGGMDLSNYEGAKGGLCRWGRWAGSVRFCLGLFL